MGLSLHVWRAVGQGKGGIMHLWGLNERRLIAKHAAYKMTETLRWPNKPRSEIDRMYSLAFDPSQGPTLRTDLGFHNGIPAAGGRVTGRFSITYTRTPNPGRSRCAATC
jgi:hypothetical protein